jgi:hypothetical protein
MLTQCENAYMYGQGGMHSTKRNAWPLQHSLFNKFKNCIKLSFILFLFLFQNMKL